MALKTHPPAVSSPTRHRITVTEFERMIAANIWPEDERLELIEGELIVMSPLNSPHARTVQVLLYLLIQKLQRQALVWTQNPMRLDDGSRPEPDVMLLHYRANFYRDRLPTPEDVLLIVEVSDTTL